LGGALLAGALFALHPLRVESVGWLTERRDVVSGAFWIAALLAWCRYVQDGRRARDYAFALVLLALSLGAKAWGITFGVLLLVLDVYVFRRRAGADVVPWRTLVLEKVPFVALGAVFGALALWAQASAGSTLKGLASHGVLQRLAQAGYAAVFYPLKTLWPAELRVVYALPEPFEPGAPRFVLAVLVALALTLAALACARRTRGVAACAGAWLAFLVVIAPVSGLAQAGPQLVAERYTYLACLPFAFAAAALLVQLPARWAWSASLALCLVLALRTHAQSRVWLTSETLWRNVLTFAPDEANAHVNLAQARIHAAEASADPRAALALYAEAQELLRSAGPHAALPQVELNQGVVHERLAALEPERAPEHLAEALRCADLGLARAEAAGQFQARWFHGRAAVLFKLERFDEARADLERAARAEPGTVEYRRAHALVLGKLGRHAEARGEWRAAVELAPLDASLLVRLARSANAAGARDEARAAYARAVELARNGAPLPSAELDEARAAQ
jgi:tetratricopeptide (TPR) repeat protein